MWTKQTVKDGRADDPQYNYLVIYDKVAKKSNLKFEGTENTDWYVLTW